MLKHLLLAALIAAAPAACLHAAEPAPSATSDSAAKQTLDAFFAAQWERGLRESPEGATYSGDTRFNARWRDYHLAAIAKSSHGHAACRGSGGHTCRSRWWPEHTTQNNTYIPTK